MKYVGPYTALNPVLKEKSLVSKKVTHCYYKLIFGALCYFCILLNVFREESGMKQVLLWDIALLMLGNMKGTLVIPTVRRYKIHV
jgi:hypothetical protein